MSSKFPLAKLTFLIAILTAVGQMTQTMYVPSIGQMAQEFRVNPAMLQAVMACYLIPYGLSQFVYGPLSDKLGRKPIILVGLAIYLVGAVISLFAHSFELFLLGSFIQGAGIGSGGAMSRTLSRDCFSGEELHRANSIISMCVIFFAVACTGSRRCVYWNSRLAFELLVPDAVCRCSNHCYGIQANGDTAARAQK